jgi:putative peptidoglycan lipid II flippase
VEHRNVIRSAGIVGGFTLWSRALGLIRDILMASIFGTGMAMSAFVVAFTIPNLFRRLFGEGALSAAFLPVFVETREKEGSAAAWILARQILSLLTLFLGILVLIGIIGITVHHFFFPETINTPTGTILSLLRIMLPYTLFICLAALCMAILNAHHHFATSAFAPSLLNVVWISALLFACPFWGDRPDQQIYGVAWAILLAGILQWAIQIPKMRHYGYHAGWTITTRDPKVKRVFRLMGPASLGMAITQINVLVDRLMAIWIGPWAPAALFFSERLIYFPQGIFATALSTVLLPVFSGQAARVDHDKMRKTIHYALCNLLYVMIPAAVGLFVLARPIVQMIFEYRAFGETSTDYTALALMFYAPGLLVFSLSKVMVPAFYALQDTRTPVKVAFFSVTLKIGLSLIFIWTWPLHLKHAGLALATVIGEAVNGLILGLLLQRRLGALDWHRIGFSAIRCLLAATVMGIATHLLHDAACSLFGHLLWPAKIIQIIAVLTAISCATLLYGILTWLLNAPEIHSVTRALREKITKKRSST